MTVIQQPDSDTMYRISSEIIVNAPRERVWQILTDSAVFGEWNPLITELTGRLGLGEKLFVRLTLPEKRAFIVKPKVIEWNEGRSFAWRGRLLIPGIFDGEHHFEMFPLDNNQIRFVQWERFSGILAGILMKLIGKSTEQGFIAMNEALKKRAESGT
jgi:hypothetical protein